MRCKSLSSSLLVLSLLAAGVSACKEKPECEGGGQCGPGARAEGLQATQTKGSLAATTNLRSGDAQQLGRASDQNGARSSKDDGDSKLSDVLNRLGLSEVMTGIASKLGELKNQRDLFLNGKSDVSKKDGPPLKQGVQVMSERMKRNDAELSSIEGQLKAVSSEIKAKQATELTQNLREIEQVNRKILEIVRSQSIQPGQTTEQLTEAKQKVEAIVSEMASERSRLDFSKDLQEPIFNRLDDLSSSLKSETSFLQGEPATKLAELVQQLGAFDSKIQSQSGDGAKRIEEISSKIASLQGELKQLEAAPSFGDESSKGQALILEQAIAESRAEFFQIVSTVNETKRAEIDRFDFLQREQKSLRDDMAALQLALGVLEKNKERSAKIFSRALRAFDDRVKALEEGLLSKSDHLDADLLKVFYEAVVAATTELDRLRAHMAAMQKKYEDISLNVTTGQIDIVSMLQGGSQARPDSDQQALSGGHGSHLTGQSVLIEVNAVTTKIGQDVADFSQTAENMSGAFDKRSSGVVQSLMGLTKLMEVKGACQLQGSPKNMGSQRIQEIKCQEALIEVTTAI
jgi:hypothetical protein